MISKSDSKTLTTIGGCCFGTWLWYRTHGCKVFQNNDTLYLTMFTFAFGSLADALFHALDYVPFQQHTWSH